MKILVVGGGGREHTIIRKLKENSEVKEIFAMPGNAGIACDAVCLPYKATDIDAAVKFSVENGVDFVVVAPDDPLCMGMVDALENVGIAAFGPSKAAAEIEGSKVFSKNLMAKYGIPTAEYVTFDDYEEALSYLKTAELPIVVKADGLALGKGAVVCVSRAEAKDAIMQIMVEKRFGESGGSVVIEEFMFGKEVTALVFTDGETILPMISATDHKRALDDNRGANTGGMGTIAPSPYFTKEIADECMNSIFLPTIRAMKAEGRTFKGCLYFGLMLTGSGAKVVEYNCRFGDPETQVVLPLLKTDLLTLLRATRDGNLDKIDIEFEDKAACCLILASGGYPDKYDVGKEIFGLNSDGQIFDATVYHAGTKLENGKFYTNGGRVLGVTRIGDNLNDAVEKAYDSAKNISFENMHYRKDIGK